MKVIIVIVISLFSCGSDDSTKSSAKEIKSPDNLQKKESLLFQEPASLKPLANSKQILGRWQSHGKESILVLITAGSIFYVEHHEAHKYAIKGDSIFIDYPGFEFSAKVGMVEDSLMFESEQGRNKMTKK